MRRCRDPAMRECPARLQCPEGQRRRPVTPRRWSSALMLAATSTPAFPPSAPQRAGRRSSRCGGTCVPTSTATPFERGSVTCCDGQGVKRGNGSGSRASSCGRPGASLPRLRGPLDQADRRPSRPLSSDGQGVLLRPDGRKARAVKARYVGRVPRLRRLHSAAQRICAALHIRCSVPDWVMWPAAGAWPVITAPGGGVSSLPAT